MRRLALPAVLFVGYATAAKVGLSLASVHPSATAFWPPTGIALAAFLRLGLAVWPAIFAGAFVVNLFTAGSVATSISIGIGNTLEGLLGAWLVGRFAHGRHAFNRPGDIFRFAALVGLFCAPVSATSGVTSLSLGGYAPWDQYESIWLTWWLGDLSGALLFASLLLVWSDELTAGFDRRQRVEAGALFLYVVVSAVVVFGGAFAPLRHLPVAFLCIPAVVWAAFRFGQRATATAIVMLSVIAAWGSVRGFGPFAVGPQNENLLLLQAFLGTIVVMAMPMAALVAEDKRVHEELHHHLTAAQAARVDAESVNRAKDEFLATLSHELRTPLSAILGWTSILRSRPFDPARAERALATIERNARAQSQLVEDLLDVSRVISGKLQLEMAPVDLARVVEAAVDMVRPSAQARRIRLVSVTERLLRVGDADRLQQAMWNLLTNAIKFTPDGGRVDTRIEAGASVVRLIVSDTGRGIDPNFLPHVFERFRQEDSSTTRTHGGLGLGLAIVRAVAEAHGGTVTAFSAGVGQGTTFTIELPLVEVVERRTDHDRSRLESVDQLVGVRVLVVDDAADERELFTEMLSQYGAQVAVADTVRSALEHVEHFRPHIIVSDIAMPVEDGYVLLRELREHRDPLIARTPVLAVTAHARAQDRTLVLAAGFDRYISKPVEPTQLVRAIAAIISGHPDAATAANGSVLH